jgi:hypothetical protein
VYCGNFPRLIGARRIVGVQPAARGPVDGIGQFTLPQSMVDQMVDKLVEKVTPVARQMVEDQKTVMFSSVEGGLPLIGASAIGFFATFFLAPDIKWAKFAGYSGSTVLALLGVYRIVQVAQVPGPTG